MRKVVYLIEQPLDARNYDRFGIQAWIDRDWTVEVWDLTPWAHPRVWIDFLESEREIKQFAGYFPIASNKQLKARISKFAWAECFVDLTGEDYCSLRAKLPLIRRGALRIICATGSIPVPQDDEKSALISKMRKALAKGPNKILNALVSVFLRRLTAPFIRPDLAIVSGERSIFSAGQSRVILKVHSFDYDIYLKLAKSIDVPSREYAVFIDQDSCFHSDFIYQGVPFFVTPEKYFPAICNGLKEISSSLEVGVRIAAHPRASYKRRNFDCFSGFPIEYGRTAELVKGCSVVICHDSTAIHFAVLFGKPLIFVTTDELIPSYEGRSIDRAASEFGKSPINLDRDLQDIDWQKETYVDFRKYTDYKNQYIKIDGTPERPMWEIVIDYVEQRKDATAAGVPNQCASAGGRG